eukprot:384722-Ditylum_brightwellii.AAC.1
MPWVAQRWKFVVSVEMLSSSKLNIVGRRELMSSSSSGRCSGMMFSLKNVKETLSCKSASRTDVDALFTSNFWRWAIGWYNVKYVSLSGAMAPVGISKSFIASDMRLRYIVKRGRVD